MHQCCSVCQRVMIGGEFVVPGEEVISPRGEEQQGEGKKSRAELCCPPPFTPVLRSVIFVRWRELTHTNTSSLFSLPLLGSRGHTESWELESQ